ncbi:hypothetical protein PICST_33329 [Scheffersomyces stipitis CBS 6054]|uniref:Uncharacterized protein n=1 Tax=Scheffersomyces stipitis (strain ATCC 58785 / CBS 6054 / NBRC 10063 / NRRL Y-11545) TaxID=322104 RepID=A3LYX0_PICST|nr:hypothetical protein PICST_33329 [Scheffersomyces stipitis CBS 6054]ABN68053.2 hypothetical protein PICST_33329 [Scheffersomyces stipitis CBS 6054]KAG2731318.1 hypothetical protein G9P44_005734 [Scheffersomyces stipitis]
MKVLCFLFFFAFARSLLIKSAEDIIPSKLSLSALREGKIKLEGELQSLISKVNERIAEASIRDEDEELLVLPRQLLNSKVLNKLGLNSLVEGGSLFNLSIHKNLNHDNILVPPGTKSLFIFNSSDSLKIPKRVHHNFSRFIDSSPPFNLPEVMNFVDYYMVLPRSYLKNISWEDTDSVYYRSLLKVRTTKLPIFRKCISENKPLLVFMFNRVSDKAQAMKEEGLSTVMTVKNFLKSKISSDSVSSFFDKFASTWVNNVAYDSLLHSVFCSTNTELMEDSYCLKIGETMKTVFLYPAFFDINRLSRRNDNEQMEVTADAQAIRQAHDKLSVAADRLDEITYELATDPKKLIKEYDEKVDTKVADLVDRTKLAIERLEEKKEVLKEEVKNKLNKARKLRKASTSQQYDLDNEQDEDNESYDYIDSEDNMYSTKKKRSEIFDEDTWDKEDVERGLELPLSLINLKKPGRYARTNEYSQIIFDYGTETIPSLVKRAEEENSEECTPITWYNIFHHSIFGKTKFCEDQSSIRN